MVPVIEFNAVPEKIAGGDDGSSPRSVPGVSVDFSLAVLRSNQLLDRLAGA